MKQCGQENAERTGEGQPDSLFAAEKFDEGAVGRLGKEHREDVGDGVVHPMEDDARHDAVGVVVEPTEQQTEQRGMEELRHVGVDGAEKQGGEDDGQPVVAGVEDTEQRAENGTAKHHFLGDGHEDADAEIAGGLSHDFLEHLLHFGGCFHSEKFEHPLRGDDGSAGEDGDPKQQCPRACADVVA